MIAAVRSCADSWSAGTFAVRVEGPRNRCRSYVPVSDFSKSHDDLKGVADQRPVRCIPRDFTESFIESPTLLTHQADCEGSCALDGVGQAGCYLCWT